MSGKIIGIDLGTTNSCVAIMERGAPVVIPNGEGSRTTPSVVAFKSDGERLVGQIARRQAVTNPEHTIHGIKRLMGSKFESAEAGRQAQRAAYRLVQAENGDAWVAAGGREFAPPEVSAMVLAAMKSAAEAYLGEPVQQAIVTVPAYFDDAQRQATKAAGQIAGLEINRIINEPTAAALAYGFDQKRNQRIAVYDLGGGTIDVSILEIANGVFSVLATAGDTHLGGEDFDALIVEHLTSRFEGDTGIDLRHDRVAMQRLREQAERAKHELSTQLETDINLPFIAADAAGPRHLVLTLKRNELEALVEPLAERTLAPCRQALADAKLVPTDVDEVLLVGGMSRMPLVRRKVESFFGKPANKSVNPDEVVAIGAALQGAALQGQVDEILLLDVTPLSLGVETGGGVFCPLIPRNTTIPTRKSEVFTTSVDNQPFVPIHVLQGEREMAGDNITLAKFELAPIPPAPRGVPQIEVSFDIDANGIVHVAARDMGTGRAQSMKVTAASGLSADQIDKIVAEAQRFQHSDAKRRELAELRNQAEGLLHTSERAVEDCKELVPPAIVEQVALDMVALRDLLGSGADALALRDALQQLELSAYQIADAMYGGVSADDSDS